MDGQGSWDDFARLRLRRAGLVVPDPDPTGGGVPAFVGRVTSSGTSIGVGKFLLVQPTTVLGAEVEGGAGKVTSGPASSVPVYLIGPGAATTGDLLVCRHVDHRWVAERTVPRGTGVATGGFGPQCYCQTAPATIQMTSASSTCNYGMFQSCTIQYGPTPASLSNLFLGPNCYSSTQGFPDRLAGGALFYYLLFCQFNQFSLTRVYPTSPYGSPFRDAILYTWQIGGYGNTCSPFHLDNGRPFPGSDAACIVTLDQP